PVGYVMNKPGENSTFFSRFMIWGGTLLLFFIVMHLWHFFFQHRVLGTSETMYESTVRVLSNPFYSSVYIVAQVFLAWHLCHGFQSAFQTLGLQVNTKTGRAIKTFGYGFGIIIPAGFAAIPLYFLIRQIL
ncbi:MAG: succinate dehydrogenase, partial [Bacteroidia bacterium]|nr:succinate dehydrogenase [Bacteroidia bacterium]